MTIRDGDPGTGYVGMQPAFSLVRDRLPAGSRVLDVGCGFGHVSQFLAKRGDIEVHGIEPDPVRADSAKERLRRVFRGTLAEAAASGEFNQRYDVVTFFDVLEHFPDPALALAHAGQFLLPGGSIFVMLPNSAHWRFRLKILRGDWSYHDSGLFDRTHLRFFDRTSATECLQRSGYDVELVAATRPIREGRHGRQIWVPTLFALHFLFQLSRGD
ncbi:MAG: methyltransferase domain-containing protein [Myxococcales bacterium]|nr:methyltransferase domain-containing protein [Myxococcales bacterium]